MGERELMTTREVAEFLQVTIRQVYRLAKNGQLPSTHVGGSYRFFRGEIVAYLKAHRSGMRLRGRAPGERGSDG